VCPIQDRNNLVKEAKLLFSYYQSVIIKGIFLQEISKKGAEFLGDPQNKNQIVDFEEKYYN
jgi:hypothetical protein